MPTGLTSSTNVFDQSPCRIPWYQDQTTFYHCSSLFSCFPDQPVNNITRYCQKGLKLIDN